MVSIVNMHLPGLFSTKTFFFFPSHFSLQCTLQDIPNSYPRLGHSQSFKAFTMNSLNNKKMNTMYNVSRNRQYLCIWTNLIWTLIYVRFYILLLFFLSFLGLGCNIKPYTFKKSVLSSYHSALLLHMSCNSACYADINVTNLHMLSSGHQTGGWAKE